MFTLGSSYCGIGANRFKVLCLFQHPWGVSAVQASAALDCLESRAADAAAAVAAAAGRIESSVREGADDIWKMEPEELFSWSGFPDIDLKNIVDKVCGRKD